MKKSKWPGFLFTIAVRFLGGLLLGCLACALIVSRARLRAFSHDNARRTLLWLALCGLAGGIIAVFTTPNRQRPWHKGIGDRHDHHRPK
jgi:drug/metabolite transporter (DMT)-like permease